METTVEVRRCSLSSGQRRVMNRDRRLLASRRPALVPLVLLLIFCLHAVAGAGMYTAFFSLTTSSARADTVANVEVQNVQQSPPQPCVLQSGELDGSYPAFPSVLRTSTHQVFATWRLSSEHQDAGGKIMFSQLMRPFDQCHWSQPQVIATEPSPDHNIGPAGITQAADGSLLIGVIRYNASTQGPARQFRSHVARSTDSGATWGSLEPIDAGYAGDISYPASLATLPDGSSIAALYGNDNPEKAYDGTWYVRLVRSTDNGRTWNPWGNGVTMTDGRQWSEPQLLVEGRRVIMTLRYDAPQSSSDTSGAFLVTSTDSGKSWSTPHRITDNTSGMPTIAKLHNGRYALAYRDMSQQGYPFRYAISHDLKTWTPDNDVTGGSHRRMLYAGFTPLDTMSSLVVYALENPDSNPRGWASLHSAIIE
jgi:hypothetical protein